MILDLGLALSRDDDVTRYTMTGDILGTPAYMAPEQAAGQRNSIGPATDVHALALTLYELLSGNQPFLRDSAAATVVAVMSHVVEPITELREGLPGALSAVIMKALAAKPEDRYPSMEEFRRAVIEAMETAAIEPAMQAELAAWLKDDELCALARAEMTERSAKIEQAQRAYERGRRLQRALVIAAASFVFCVLCGSLLVWRGPLAESLAAWRLTGQVVAENPGLSRSAVRISRDRREA